MERVQVQHIYIWSTETDYISNITATTYEDTPSSIKVLNYIYSGWDTIHVKISLNLGKKIWS